MGCDIHCYVDYKRKDSTHWNSFGERINPGRNYTLFGLLAGVRGENSPYYPVRGIPSDIGYCASSDYWLYISHDSKDQERNCSPEQAEKYIQYGSHYNEDRTLVSHPDWHSHSWLSITEFATVLDRYHTIPLHPSAIEYRALLAAMRVLNEEYDVRIVFWFDN